MRAALLLALAAADTCDLPALPSFTARPARLDSDCPRVYVYDIPQLYDYEIPWPELHKANVTQIFGMPCHDGILDEFDTNQYSLALLVLWRLATSARCGAVDDPKDADLFFVPTWPAAKGLPAWDRACGHPANAKVKHLPYLNERTAHRHFFIVGKGHVVPKRDCKYWWLRPEGLLARASRFAYSDQYGKSHTLASYGPAPFDDARAAKQLAGDRISSDQGIAPHLFSVPYPAAVHAWGAHSRPWEASEERPTLAAYVGGDRNGTFSYLRPKIAALCDASDACETHVPHEGHRVCGVRCVPGLRRTMMRATFCLQPGGDSPYRKSVFDAALAGCIPVVFSQQLARVAPWQRGNFPEHFVVLSGAAVQRGEIDVMRYLASIPQTKIQELRRNLAGVAPMLQYSIDDSIRNDAFEALLRGALAVATERERLRDRHARREDVVALNNLL